MNPNVNTVLDNPEELVVFLGQHLKPKELEKKQNGEVFTPPSLINQKFDKLTEIEPGIWSNPNLKFLDPANGIGNYPALAFHRLMEGLKEVIPDRDERKKHILENMLYMCELSKYNVEISRTIFDPESQYKLNLYQGDFLDFDPFQEWGIEKFDVIFGNPPYQDKSGNKGKGHRLWVYFVKKSLNILLDNGYMLFVHPSGWRQPNNELLILMVANQIHYLEIHGENHGIKVFKCNTRYDWYVLQKTTCHKKTLIRGQDDILVEVSISDMCFVPNFMFNDILNWTSSTSKLEIIKSRSAYGHDKKHVSKVRTEDNIYPVVYSVNKSDIPTLHYSSINTKGHFGLSKVIFGSGATGFVIDPDGRYGLTQWCAAIVDEPNKLDKIVKVLKSLKFKNIISACSIGKLEINAEMLKFFSKNFFDNFELDS